MSGHNSIDNRMLWATLTPHGTTRHHMVPRNGGGGPETSSSAAAAAAYYASGNIVAGGAVNEDHYEVVDYYRHESKMNAQNSLARNGNPIGGGGGNYLRNVAPLKVKVCRVMSRENEGKNCRGG